MSTAQETTNKAAVRRFDDVVSTGDVEIISKTIDELEGEYRGHPPTGKSVTYDEVLVFRFAGGESKRSGRSSTSSRR
jgi:hypothetical protein